MSFISYAQNFEDVMLWRSLQHIKNGFYIDIGAQHPVVDSVSFSFYEHGWRGVHVEPTQQYSSLLRAARPDETVYQVAIGDQNEELKLFEFEDTGLSTADDEIARKHLANGFKCKETVVSVMSLDTLLCQVGSRDIHWLKVDVEGLEKEVLVSWKASSNLPWVVVVESTRPLTQEKSHQEWEAILLSKGYTYVYFDGLNRFYISPEHPELAEAFSAPPNIFDEFSLSGTASQPFYRLLNTKAQQAEEKFQQAEVKAQQAEAKAQQAEAKVQQAEAKAQQAEAKSQQAEAKALEAQVMAQHIEHTITAIYNSRSWRITYPLRWFMLQVQLLSAHGAKNRIKAAARKGAAPMLGKSVSFVNSRPQLRQQLVGITKKTGTYKKIKSIYHRFQHIARDDHALVRRNESPVYQSSLLTPHAQQVYQDLKKATEKNKEQQ